MRASLILLPVLLAGCTSFPLGYIEAQADKTAEQRDTAMIICRDEAKAAADTAARNVGNFIAGMTLIGVPFAAASERAKQREVFAQCMKDRGFTVRAPA